MSQGKDNGKDAAGYKEPTKRYERKYRIEHALLPEVLAGVREHPAGFGVHFPDRQINNIYLDTPELASFQENLSGVGERTKYRIRWYGADIHFATEPILEAKIKENWLGWKKRKDLPDFPVENYMDLLDLISAEIKMHQLLEPALLNTYKRKYFLSFDKKFRLTVDYEMRFYNLRMPRRDGLLAHEDDGIVVEIKYDEADDALFSRKVGPRFPFKMTKNSKFVNGVIMATDH